MIPSSPSPRFGERGLGGEGFYPAHLIAEKFISLIPLNPSPSPPRGRREQERCVLFHSRNHLMERRVVQKPRSASLLAHRG